ncbi:hypothetical protein ALC56_11668, partial [Trachymyrmex septentrionalis]
FNMSVEEQCKRNPELKMSDLQILKDWMVKQPHLPRVEMLYLILFLYSNYYRIEPFKKTIDNFYTIRILLPEVFSNRDPIRVFIYSLNTISIVDTLMNLIKPLLKKELMNLLHFYSSMETVKKFLPIEALPNDYGGKAGPIEEITIKHIAGGILLNVNRRVNESLRVGKCESTKNLFGVQ